MVGILGGRKKKKRPPVAPVFEITHVTHPWLFCLGIPSKKPLASLTSCATGDAALKKSWDLLMEHLDETQQHDLRTIGMFIVTKPRGTVVTIRADLSQVNVVQTTLMGRRIRYCTMPKVSVPLWDLILTQVLAVKYNWKWFREMAVKM